MPRTYSGEEVEHFSSGSYPAQHVDVKGLSEPEWRQLVMDRFNHGEQRFDRQDAVLSKMNGLLDTWTTMKTGGEFLKWLGGIVVACIAAYGLFKAKS